MRENSMLTNFVRVLFFCRKCDGYRAFEYISLKEIDLQMITLYNLIENDYQYQLKGCRESN